MFLTVTIFLLVLLLSFTVVMLLTRPSTIERAIEDRITGLRGAGETALQPDDPQQLIKRTRLSTLPWLDALLQRIQLAQRVQLLITQAQSSWDAGGVLCSSGALAVVG